MYFLSGNFSLESLNSRLGNFLWQLPEGQEYFIQQFHAENGWEKIVSRDLNDYHQKSLAVRICIQKNSEVDTKLIRFRVVRVCRYLAEGSNSATPFSI